MIHRPRTMSEILILYYSRHGSVRQLAHACARGVESVGNAAAVLRTVPPVSPVSEATAPGIPDKGDIYAEAEDLERCSGLILGSPTRFGSVSAPIKHFFDQTTPQWLNGTLMDKPAGVFTSTSSLHGGQESTLLSMMLPLIHHGMVMVGIPYYQSPIGATRTGGTPYGASHVQQGDGAGPLSDDESEAAQLLGQRIARIALKLEQELAD